MKNFKKIKKHGVKGSIKILKQKTNVFLYNLKIGTGHYSFINREKYLNKNINIFLEYVRNLELNSNINFTRKLNLENTINNQHYLLGKAYRFGKDINWHFNSNDISKSYSLDFSNRLKIMDFEKYGDYRITWELNRHHHFVWYAQNFYKFNNNKFIEKFHLEINNWVKSNKPGYGVNYTSSMEIAIRLINWLISFIIFGKKTDIRNILNHEIINSIMGQILFLNDNLFIKRKYKNNHSIVELTCLIVLNYIFRLENTTNIDTLYMWLFKELNDQFYDDGINFEHSTTYSRFTIESILILLFLVKDDKVKTKNEKLSKLVKSYVDSLRKFVTPKNIVPLFSDSDNGRMLFLSGTNKDFIDFRGFFDFCAIHFNDDDLFISNNILELKEETKWWSFLDNKELRCSNNNKNGNSSTFFPNGGYFIKKSDNIFLAFKANYPGNTKLKNEYAPHAHNDILSFEVYLDDQPFLVDSGTYTYNHRHGNYRKYFRSAYAHNTIIIDGKPQFEFYEFFGARNFPEVEIKKNDENNVLGTIKYKDGSYLHREIRMWDNRIEFTDIVGGLNKDNVVEINLNFDKSVVVTNIDNQKKKISCTIDSKTYNIYFNHLGSSELKVIQNVGWVSDFYNCKTKNQKLIFKFNNILSYLQFNWSIYLNEN